MFRGYCSASIVLIGMLLVLIFACDTGHGNSAAEAPPQAGQNAAETEKPNSEGYVLEELTEVIKKNPEDPDAYYARADAYLDLDELQRALDDLGRTLELDPNHVDANILIGIVYGKMGRIEEAIDSFDKAIELSPENATAYSNRGFAYSLIDNLELACEDWKTACNLGDCKWYDMAGYRGQCDK